MIFVRLIYNITCIVLFVHNIGGKKSSINYNCYSPVSAAPIADSRKGCPYEVRCLKFVRIFERRTKFAPTVCKTSFSEEFMPLSRHRCVEVAAPYKPRVNEFVRVLWADDIRLYRALFHYSLRGRIISAPTYFE